MVLPCNHQIKVCFLIVLLILLFRVILSLTKSVPKGFYQLYRMIGYLKRSFLPRDVVTYLVCT